MANNSASGMLMGTMMAVRILCMNINKMTTTKPTPIRRFSDTVSVMILRGSVRS